MSSDELPVAGDLWKDTVLRSNKPIFNIIFGGGGGGTAEEVGMAGSMEVTWLSGEAIFAWAGGKRGREEVRRGLQVVSNQEESPVVGEDTVPIVCCCDSDASGRSQRRAVVAGAVAVSIAVARKENLRERGSKFLPIHFPCTSSEASHKG